MQDKSKHTFSKSKMNKDLDARLIERGEYRDGVNVSVSRSEGDDVGALENILGNNFLDNLQNIHTGDGDAANPYSGVSPVQVIGWHIQENTDSVYLFTTNYQDNSSDGISNAASPKSVHKIIYFDTQANTSQVIVEGEFLNFSINSPIFHTNLLENLLFWTDNRNQPRKINVDTAKANPSYYFNEDHISVAKYSPWNPIKVLDTFQGKGVVVNKDITADAGTWPLGFAAWRDFIMFPTDVGDPNSLSAEACAFLQNNIGCKGYGIDNAGNRWEFTVAWADFDGGEFPVAPTPAGWAAPKFCVWIEREPATNFTLWTTGEPIPNYTFVFKGTTQVDASSKWLEESKSKLTVIALGVGLDTNRIIYGINPPANRDQQYAAPLYKYGTRSRVQGLVVPDTPWQGATCVSFEILNPLSFQYGIIKHPNIPETKTYYIKSKVNNPDTASTGNLYNWFDIEDDDGPVDASTIGLAVNDVITVYWPNPNYTAKFFGDEAFLEDKFVRFSYRFEYDDGEYSTIAPFTQPMFIPKQKGYFEKRVGSVKAFPQDDNYLQSQEQLAGQNTVVDFFVNEVSQINLKIPLECPVNLLKDQFKVKSIDILYKESTELALRVVDTISIDDPLIVGNSTTLLNFLYQSQKPIKVLDDKEISRVYDNVPIRAAAQESSGNRMIYGNFYDRHTSPLNLDYLVNASPKFTLHNEQTKDTNISLPNHTLKQRRTYQTGLVLSDRYGRSSDVILSSFLDENHEIAGIGSFGGSTVYHPYLNSITEPLTSSATFNTTTHVDAGIYSWPGDSLKILFSNTIPTAISNAAGYPGLYRERVTILDITGNGGAGSRSITINPVFGDPAIVQPGMEITWTDSAGITYVDTITSFTYDIAAVTGTIFVQDGTNLPSGVAPENKGQVNKKNTLGWYSYKVVVKQQEQDYYNVYLPSLLNGNPVVKPFQLELAAANIADTRIEVNSTMGDPRTFLLLEGMQMKLAADPQVYTVTNILNNELFDINPPLKTSVLATTEATFTTLSTRNAINVTTLLTDNANKVPPALVETTPVQQQYSTSQTRLIPRVAIGPKVPGYTYPFNEAYFTTIPYVNKQIYPGKESLKVNSLGNFANMFVDGSYAGLWQADTDPPAMIVQNKFQLGVFAEDVVSGGGTAPTDQLQFSCYETTPVKSNLEIFYESSTSGLIKELNTSIEDGLDIPIAIHEFVSLGASTKSLGTVSWNESVRAIFPFELLDEFVIVDANGTALKDISVPGGTIVSVEIANETYRNGIYAGVENTIKTIPPSVELQPVYDIDYATDPLEQAAGIYKLKFNLTGSNAAGNYHRQDDDYNHITIDLNVTVRIFGATNTFTQVFPFQIQTYVNNSAPIDSSSSAWIVGDPTIDMQAFVDIVNSWPVANNSGTAETKNPAALNSPTKTFNGAKPLRANKVAPPAWAGSNELVYKLYLETAVGSGVYEDISTTPMTGLTLVSEVSTKDQADIYSLSVGDVKYNGSAAPGTYGYAIGATDKNGFGLTTYVSKFRMNIIY